MTGAFRFTTGLSGGKAIVLLLFAWSWLLSPQTRTAANEAAKPGVRHYNYQVIDYPGKVTMTEFDAINDDGVVLGSYNTHSGATGTAYDCDPWGDPTSCLRTFIYEGGQFIPIDGPLFGGKFTKPVALNNAGQVLVYQVDRTVKALNQRGVNQYFIYSIREKTFRPVGLAGQLEGNGKPSSMRIGSIKGFNDRGEILGGFGGGVVVGTPIVGPAGSTTPPAQAGRYRKVSAKCPNGGQMSMIGLNNHGQITGQCPGSAAVYSAGSVAPFKYPGAASTVAKAINNAGAVVGWAQLGPSDAMAADIHSASFFFDGSQSYPVTPPGGRRAGTQMLPARDSEADGVNDKGQIVGVVTSVRGIGEGYIATPTQ